eukprot:TRINITY_DN27993_c0_g1_i2.p1 TRINITY_DN27993_c0_g1~~TRINITY_DN27993_c0_g1_i2.p1  ORF type:complete len:572 (-),score=120.69 TRINITY_DN27993_c0_g1_i2:40-1755(-)
MALLRLSVLVVLVSVALGRLNENLDACNAEKDRLASRVKELEALLESQLNASPISLGEHLLPVGSPAFYHTLAMAALCVTGAALAAGLTMGMVSIDPLEMEIIVKAEEKDIEDEQARQKLKDDQDAAEKILPLIHDHHQLLVTLLLMNSVANEALPLFLDQLVPSWLAVVLSVSLVLMFGEIIPSAVFTGKDQLSMAARFAGLVSTCKFILAPIAWPIASALDIILGADHKGRYNFAELRAVVGLHANINNHDEAQSVIKGVDDNLLGIITMEAPHNFTSETAVVFTSIPGIPAESTKLQEGQTYYVKPCQPLYGQKKKDNIAIQLFTTPERRPQDLLTFEADELTSGVLRTQERDEIKIMHGVMNLTHMTTLEALTPLSKTYMLSASAELSRETFKDIDKSGHSRIPVYDGDKHNVRGFLLVKKLILIQHEADKKATVGTMKLMPMTLVSPATLMLDLLNKFQEDKCHLALVTDMPEAVADAWKTGATVPPDVHMVGIITLEDVMEKLIQENIEDESDNAFARSFSTRSIRQESPKVLPAPSPSKDSLREPLLHYKADTLMTHLGIPAPQ